MKRAAPALEAALAQLDAAQLRRFRATVESADGRTLALADGRALLDFSSNDYLGLARHPELAAAMAASAHTHGAGSGAAHLVCGHGSEHARLEEELAAFTGRERALLFSTGYMANLAVLAALAGRGERVLLDRLCHASLIDGAQLSGARLRRYPHLDAATADRWLSERDATVLVATDGVFSMDGDVAPLPQLADAARRHGAWLLVDDAHGIGVTGASGRGSLEQFGLDAEAVPLLVGTLGKALGSFGAFIAGDAQVIELLMQKARTYVYTTALPQPVAAATRAALRLVQAESWRRERLHRYIARFRAAAAAAHLALLPSATPIQPVPLKDAGRALAAQRALAELGFWVAAIRPPTVPRGAARLRVTLSAAHTESEIDALVAALVRVCRPLQAGLAA
jgi:8-amino-7-oxononanoate synthase